MQRRLIPVTSVRLLGVKVPVKQLKIERNDEKEEVQGTYFKRVIRLTTEGYTVDQLLRTLAHEATHAFLDISGMVDGVCGGDGDKEEMLVAGIEQHLYPVFRALVRLEAGLPPDAEDKRVLGLARKKETAV